MGTFDARVVVSYTLASGASATREIELHSDRNIPSDDAAPGLNHDGEARDAFGTLGSTSTVTINAGQHGIPADATNIQVLRWEVRSDAGTLAGQWKTLPQFLAALPDAPAAGPTIPTGNVSVITKTRQGTTDNYEVTISLTGSGSFPADTRPTFRHGTLVGTPTIRNRNMTFMVQAMSPSNDIVLTGFSHATATNRTGLTLTILNTHATAAPPVATPFAFSGSAAVTEAGTAATIRIPFTGPAPSPLGATINPATAIQSQRVDGSHIEVVVARPSADGSFTLTVGGKTSTFALTAVAAPPPPPAVTFDLTDRPTVHRVSGQPNRAEVRIPYTGPVLASAPAVVTLTPSQTVHGTPRVSGNNIIVVIDRPASGSVRLTAGANGKTSPPFQVPAPSAPPPVVPFDLTVAPTVSPVVGQPNRAEVRIPYTGPVLGSAPAVTLTPPSPIHSRVIDGNNIVLVIDRPSTNGNFTASANSKTTPSFSVTAPGAPPLPGALTFTGPASPPVEVGGQIRISIPFSGTLPAAFGPSSLTINPVPANLTASASGSHVILQFDKPAATTSYTVAVNRTPATTSFTYNIAAPPPPPAVSLSFGATKVAGTIGSQYIEIPYTLNSGAMPATITIENGSGESYSATIVAGPPTTLQVALPSSLPTGVANADEFAAHIESFDIKGPGGATLGSVPAPEGPPRVERIYYERRSGGGNRIRVFVEGRGLVAGTRVDRIWDNVSAPKTLAVDVTSGRFYFDASPSDTGVMTVRIEGRTTGGATLSYVKETRGLTFSGITSEINRGKATVTISYAGTIPNGHHPTVTLDQGLTASRVRVNRNDHTITFELPGLMSDVTGLNVTVDGLNAGSVNITGVNDTPDAARPDSYYQNRLNRMGGMTTEQRRQELMALAEEARKSKQGWWAMLFAIMAMSLGDPEMALIYSSNVEAQIKRENLTMSIATKSAIKANISDQEDALAAAMDAVGERQAALDPEDRATYNEELASIQAEMRSLEMSQSRLQGLNSMIEAQTRTALSDLQGASTEAQDLARQILAQKLARSAQKYG